MAHDNHASNVKRIWFVFGLLSLVTIVEVVLGIIRPEFLVMTNFLRMSLLNWIFILLTIYKAYYIVWSFMHMEGESAALRWAVVGTLVIYVLYLVFILLEEGSYIHDVLKYSTIKWNF